MSDFEQRIEVLFDQALDLPAQERVAFVERETEGQPDLRKAVFALLQHDDDMPSSFMPGQATAPAGATAAAAAPFVMPDNIGDYRVVRSIGSGGMGVIYEAEQTSPRRRVALKVIRPGLVSQEVIRRFQHEAQILGYLQHPGIAQIYEAQTAEVAGTETPFLAMELIRGQRIDDYARTRQFDAKQIVELLARVCDAVHHAHQKGVLHRDLKPSNILVTEADSSMIASGELTPSPGVQIDAVGQPKVLDFGVARVTDADQQMETMQTQEGQIIGTLAYMSPEQVRGANQDIDIRSDVYALGVVLFELLTKQLPHTLHGLSFIEAARRIQEEPPTRATTLDTNLRGDLDTILQKALDRDRDRRYGSAADLAADLRRFLRHEPILARRPSLGYQARKFASRNKALVVGVFSTLVMLILGAVGTAAGWFSALQALDDLERTNKQLRVTNDALAETRDELEDIAWFQADRIASVDVAQMGARLRQELLSGVDDEARQQMDTLLIGANFTDLALESLSENVLRPTREAIERDFSDQPGVQARLLQSLARTWRELGAPRDARPVQQQAYEIRREVLGADHSDTLYSLSQLGLLLQAIGELEEAEAAFREVIDRTPIPGAPNKSDAVNLGNLSIVLRNRGQLDEAEALLHQSLEILESLENVDAEVLSAKRALSLVYDDRGELDKAAELIQEVMEGRSELLGADDVNTLRAKASMATFLGRLGKAAESEQLLREILDSQKRILGTNHPSTLTTMSNLSMAVQEQSKFAEAAGLAGEAFELTEQHLGPYHRTTMNALNTLAATLDAMGKFDEAEALYADCLARYEKMHGPDHPDTLLATGNYGYILGLQHRNEEALVYYRRAYEGLLKRFGSEHPRTLTSLGNLAVMLNKLGRLEEAEPLYKASLEGRRKLLGPKHPSTMNAIFNMGDMLISMDKLDEADPYATDALRLYRELGETHIGTLYSLGNLGRLREAQGRFDEAVALYEEAYLSWQKITNDDHSETINARRRLASLLEKMEVYEESEGHRRALLEQARASEDPPGLLTAGGLRDLARNLALQERYGPAEETFLEAYELASRLEGSTPFALAEVQIEIGAVIGQDGDRAEQAEEWLVEGMNALLEVATDNKSELERVAKARQRVIDFYVTGGRPEEAERWRE